MAVVWEGYDYYVSHRVAPASAWPFETRRARELARTSPELQAMLALPARERASVDPLPVLRALPCADRAIEARYVSSTPLPHICAISAAGFAEVAQSRAIEQGCAQSIRGVLIEFAPCLSRPHTTVHVVATDGHVMRWTPGALADAPRTSYVIPATVVACVLALVDAVKTTKLDLFFGAYLGEIRVGEAVVRFAPIAGVEWPTWRRAVPEPTATQSSAAVSITDRDIADVRRYTRAALAARRAESRSTGLGYERIERVVLDCDGLRPYTPGMPLADSDVLLDVANLQRVTAGLRSVDLIRTSPSTPCLVRASGAPQIVGIIAPRSHTANNAKNTTPRG